jgi:hypothetical protein
MDGGSRWVEVCRVDFLARARDKEGKVREGSTKDGEGVMRNYRWNGMCIDWERKAMNESVIGSRRTRCPGRTRIHSCRVGLGARLGHAGGIGIGHIQIAVTG